MASWYYAILVYFVASSSYSILQRKYSLTSKIPLGLIPGLIFAIFVYPIGLITSSVIGDFWFHVQWQSFALIILASIAIGSFNVAPFKINKYIDTTQYLIISNIYTPIVVLIGVFLLNEPFTLTQTAGMILLVLGAILVAAKGFTKLTFSFDKHSVELAGLAILLGIGLAAEKASLSYMSKSSYMIFGWGLQAIVTLFLARKDFKYIRRIDRSDIRQLAELGIARTGHIIGFFLAVALSKNVALIASLSSFRIPIVFIASIFILKERDNLARKFIGVLIATIGIILL